jgi:predicted RNA-binding Zn ribbon-like protein
VLTLREALRTLFQAAMHRETPDAAALALVNAASVAAPLYPVIEWPAGRPPRALVHHRAEGAASLPLAVIARSGIGSGIDLLSSDKCRLLRTCEGPGCVLLFLAASPRRHWCSSAVCGNRVRVARHCRRRHGSDAIPANRRA